MSDNIKVVVKVRPLIPREIEEKHSYQWRIKNNTLHQLDNNGREFGTSFTFDKVYDNNTKSSDIYNDVAKPIVEAATAGFNGTIFAYGQTSSGKTYTMTGTEDSPGIIPLAVRNLFQIIRNIPDRDFLVRVSYIEIYNETLKDLLNVDKKNIKVHENFQGIKVDCTEQVTTSPEEVLKYLKEGEANRQTGATNMNEESSRSHSIFQITIESREHIEGEKEVGSVNVSILNLVDLAGSERAGQTGATGIRFIEGTHINKSLSALALVIKQLSEGQNKHVNYRDSKLTRILQNSLGGNAKTSIICAVTPAAVEETISTLQFANRAKAIKNKPEVNAVATDATMIQSLTKQLSKLQSQLESKKNLEVILESKKNVEHNLQKQIAALQRLILNGFGTRSSLDMLASRQKLVQPRRITISTLHPIEENPAPQLPKFHTPLLKYNPMVIGTGSTDFLPIQNTKKLTCVSEETDNRLVTPPPQEKKVNFSDEIIELDSDDDNSTLDAQNCSPYHKCYGSSKTPPCILRKNAKLAEKNLKDIVELTEREKIYSPNVVELIEKLEGNTTVINSLQEELNALHKKSKDKDLEIDQLQAKVSKSNEEMKSVNNSKAELEALCKEYTTKLTDWEVSYETLQNKTKRREQELLSLLEEQKILTKHKINDNISKAVLKNLDKEINFMDMSKDISLVNSDNESSIVNNDDETSSQFQDLVTDMQNQMSSKNESVLQLEADLISQKQKKLLIESSSHQMQCTVDSLKEKLALLENENSLLKSTLDTLNSTIKCQKSSLESAHNDIESYNSLIKELQIQLTNKEKILNVNINDNTIENMVANEEKFIANNENMKNIIGCFKVALNSRNNEIQFLKSNVTDGISVENLKEQLTVKEKEINILNDKTAALQKEIKNNTNVIDTLMEENTNLTNTEHQLTNKLTEVKEINCEENKMTLASLDCIKTELTKTVTEKNAIEKELTQINKELNKKIQELTLKVDYLEKDISSKDDLINSLNKEDQLAKESLLKINRNIQILKNILEHLNVELKDSADDNENTCDTMDTFEKILTALQSKVVAVSCQKNIDIESNLKLRKELEISNCQLKTEIADLQSKIMQISEKLSEYKKNIEQSVSERNYINKQLELKESEIISLKTELSSSKDNNEKLCSSIKSTEKEIANMLEKNNSLTLQMQVLIQENDQNSEDFNQEIEMLTDTLKINDTLMSEKDKKIVKLVQNLKTIQENMEEKRLETEVLSRKIQDFVTNENLQLENIYKHSLKLVESLDLKHDPCSDYNVNLYQKIILRLTQVSDYVERINDTNPKEIEKLNEMVLEAKLEIEHLTQYNKDLREKLSFVELSNNGLISELEEIKSENKKLNVDLLEVTHILDILRNELKEKATDIEIMVTKTQNLKDHFIGLDCVMKDQTKELMAENENLKIRCCELETIAENNLKDDAQSSIVDEINDIDGRTSTKSQCDIALLSIENQSPPSLLTICCAKIIDAIQLSEKSVSSNNSNTSVDPSGLDNRSNNCSCSELLPELKSAQLENLRLSTVVEQLEILNQHLIIEHEEVRREVQLLLEPANELQKKVNSHKTNLYTLTATTYAENKSLQSQVTSLQHHHSRFHNVCQKDLPVVKKQLCELLTILKSDNSYTDQHNASFKRYSLPSVFDNNSTLNNLKNESTLDGDLLMLDTNLTLTTSGDNTLMGIDHTCLDITQVYPNNDVACQTTDLTNDVVTENIAQQMDSLTSVNKKLTETVNILEQKNILLNREIQEIDSQMSNQTKQTISKECEKCRDFIEKEKFMEKEIEAISEELSTAKSVKADIEKKYNNIILETPSTEALVRKINSLERDWRNKAEEVSKLTNSLDSKNSEIKQLKHEIDSLSTQVMENISETDDLTKELDNFKESNAKLLLNCTNLEEQLKEAENQEKTKTSICSQCQMKDEAIKALQNLETHSKLNRSLSDSESSSRHNKICTLQNELHAGREDCKELTKEVATIKSQLERSNLSIGQSMDLDESMGESNIFTFTKQFESIGTPLTKFNVSNLNQNCELDVYTTDKADCINYIVEKTGANKENLDVNMKVIDLMKMFYNDVLTKHNNEVENFVNKLKCYEESKGLLESHVNEISTEYSKVKQALELKENNIRTVMSALSHIKENITFLSEEMYNFENMENESTQLVDMFKDKLLKILDTEFGFTSVTVFEKVINNVVTKHQNDLMSITEQYTKLQKHMETVTTELNTVNNKLLQMKCQLSDRENEYNLLKAQKERVHEISNAVTLDIIRKEQELCDVIVKGCKKLVEHNIMGSGDIDMNLPLNKNIHLLFERIITDYHPSEIEREKETLVLEIKKSKSDLEGNIKSLETMKVENDKLKEINKSVTLTLVNMENKLKSQESLNKDINVKYDSIVEENQTNILKINKITDEIKLMKEALVEKENIIRKLESELDKEVQITELMNKLSTFNQEIDNLKSINEIIVKEKETCALELSKCKEILNNNKKELCNMTSDILVLRESVKENVSIIESLKEEAKSLLQQNLELKDQIQEKCKDCSRLEMNIKTHEKTAEIQSRMIIRLQKQKEDDDKAISEKTKQIDELTQRYADLKGECEAVKKGIKASEEELETRVKEDLEQRLSGTKTALENGSKPRLSIEAAVDTTRRRRQSIHDSKRMFAEGCGDHNKIEAMFNSRPQPQDLFTDADEDNSNGSTPLRTSRGRDSLISRHESDKDDDPPSRPSSVAATRRRRQSIHDLRRSIQTPSPHERPSSRQYDSTHFKSLDIDNNDNQSEVAQLRESLSSCQQELEVLQKQYRELDEECETCSQYLREREEQCSRLKKEKAALANVVTELQEKLQTVNPNKNQQERKRSFADAYVNTDEDWANLHSVVVDRMSFDAEVDKNKRLTKTIEELRFKKQDLKNTLAKMQKALEKYAARDNNRDLEATKSELRACKQELTELKKNYKELDVECETCSQYLREREEQCRKLKDAKAALEAKLQEYEDASNVALSLRNKRRSMHDQRRPRPAHAATDTGDDFSTYQVERDCDSLTDEVTLLKSAVDKLSQQKAALEHKLVAVSATPAPNPMYIATGSAIVQNQQLTDVMKENQKLKKMNAKLVVICKKRGKICDVDNQDISEPV